jgi:hypothetical protein
VYGMIERPDGQVLLDGQPVRGHNALSQFLEEIVPEGLNGIVKITVHVALCRGEQVALGGEG